MDLATNRFMKTIHEDIRGSIILIPQLELSNQIYGRSVDATFKDGEPRELYILSTTAFEIKRFLDQRDFGRGFKIRRDRSIIPSCGTYANIDHWPNFNKEDTELVLKILKAQVIYKQEFVKFNPESLQPGSLRFHPQGFRSHVRVRADQTRQRSEWRLRGMRLSFQMWLDNLGPEIVARLTVSTY